VINLTDAPVSATAAAPTVPAQDDTGWYLYGITRCSTDTDPVGRLDHTDPDAEARLGHALDGEPVHLMNEGSLAAVIGRVRLSDFTAEVLQSRLSDPIALETLVQRHNGVIAGVHQWRTILPARLGGVYACLDEVAAAMRERHDVLLAQIDWLDGCDEWAVHVYVDPRAVQARVRTEQAASPLQHELAVARPGRAYLLRRKLEDDLAARRAQKVEELAHDACERLSRLASAVQVERPARPSGGVSGEIEELRLALLVHRERRDALVADLDASAQGRDGWRCAYTGPWPPYSFATSSERSEDDRHDA
jgi:hypothetical protein